jgi:hypothetical protein
LVRVSGYCGGLTVFGAGSVMAVLLLQQGFALALSCLPLAPTPDASVAHRGTADITTPLLIDPASLNVPLTVDVLRQRLGKSALPLLGETGLGTLRFEEGQLVWLRGDTRTLLAAQCVPVPAKRPLTAPIDLKSPRP